MALGGVLAHVAGRWKGILLASSRPCNISYRATPILAVHRPSALDRDSAIHQLLVNPVHFFARLQCPGCNGYSGVILLESHPLQSSLELLRIAPKVPTQLGLGYHEFHSPYCGSSCR